MSQLERGEPCRGVYRAHVLKANEGQGACPPLLVALDVETEGLYDRTVRSLACSVGLWVKRCRHQEPYAEQPVHFLPEFGSELRVAVGYDGVREAVQSHDVADKYPGQFGSLDVGGEWYEV